MSSYALDLSRRARDFLDGLQPKQFKQVAHSVLSLQRDPFPHDSKHLAGHPGFRLVDIGENRVCYRVEGGIIQVAVVAKRSDDAVYRELARVT